MAAAGLFAAIAAELGIDGLPAEAEAARNRVITDLGSRLLESVSPPPQPSLFDAASLNPMPPEPDNAARTRTRA